MSDIQFCHIAPINLLEKVSKYNKSHLMLAHLVEESDEYADFYKNLNIGDGSEKILDNSAFEKFKRGEPMYDSSKLIDMGKSCNATVIVMSDYPKEHWTKTRDAAIELAPVFKQHGFKTFYVPQSELGDLEGYLQSVFWAIENPDIDLIGLSILGCPIALGINESKHGEEGTRNDAYKLQRYLSRYTIFKHIVSRATETQLELLKKSIHCLGLVDGPEEIELLKEFHEYIYSWDSSSAVWAGIQGKRYDQSPTGLINGKIESEVDFHINDEYNADIEYNIELINNLCKGVK